MTINIFKRMKKTGRKKIIRELENNDKDLARDICIPHNNRVRHLDTGYWLEWTKEKDYCSN